jgi:hypothetical protein
VLLQKRAIRILNKSEFHAHTDPLFKKLNILKFEDIRLLQLGQFMYCHKNSLLPKSFNSMFVLNNQVRTYDTRHSKAFHVAYVEQILKKFNSSNGRGLIELCYLPKQQLLKNLLNFWLMLSVS